MSTAPGPATIEDLLQHAAWARRLARTLVGDADDAEDIVQESLVSSLRAGPDAGESLLPWMRQVVRNRALSHRRDRQRRRRREEAAAVEPAGATGEDAEASLARVQAHRLLADLVSELAEPLRQTVILRYYDGLDSAAIGVAMGVPAGTVRWRLKAGIDQLRRLMDRRHEGDRAVWMRALIPLAGGGPLRKPPARPRWLAPTVAVLSGLLVGLVWLGVRVFAPRLAAQSGLAVDRAGRGAGGADPRQPGRPAGVELAAAAPLDLPACQTTLASLRQQIAAVGPAYRPIEEPTRVFADGAPNPAARAQLLPGMAKVFGAAEKAGFTWDLECHTWSCKLLVVMPEDGDAKLWMKPLQADARMSELLPGMLFQAGRPVRDPVSGKPLNEMVSFLYLAETGPDPAAATPVPRDAAACKLALQVARTRLGHMRNVVARDPSPFTRHDAGAPNPALTATLTRILDRVLGADVQRFDLRLDCRGDNTTGTCRLQAGETGNKEERAWRGRVEQDAEFRRYASPFAMGNGSYYFNVDDPTRPQGIDFVRAQLHAFQAGPALAACATAHPDAAGALDVRVFLPDRAEAGAMTTDFGGTLADTPIGRCVRDALARTVVAATPPARVTSIMTFASFKFPLPK